VAHQVRPVIYLAGKTSDRFRLRRVKRALDAVGYNVCASWLAKAMDYADARCTPEHMRAEAPRDLHEVRECDIFVIDTLSETVTGGRESELGMAIAFGKRLWRVGPARQVFHHDVHESWTSWKKCLRELRGRTAR
jgi:hypothetical protein